MAWIIAFLAGTTLVSYAILLNVCVAGMGDVPEARQARVTADLRSISDASKLFKVRHGHYPVQLQDMWEKPLDTDDWEPLLEGPPSDPWGNVYRYRLVDGEPVISSLGADGAQGGAEEAADLSSDMLFTSTISPD